MATEKELRMFHVSSQTRLRNSPLDAGLLRAVRWLMRQKLGYRWLEIAWKVKRWRIVRTMALLRIWAVRAVSVRKYFLLILSSLRMQNVLAE